MIYTNILRLCKKNGVSISRLEKELGLGNATIRGWQNSTPRVENLAMVANYFGVSVDYFLHSHDTADEGS